MFPPTTWLSATRCCAARTRSRSITCWLRNCSITPAACTSVASPRFTASSAANAGPLHGALRLHLGRHHRIERRAQPVPGLRRAGDVYRPAGHHHRLPLDRLFERLLAVDRLVDRPLCRLHGPHIDGRTLLGAAGVDDQLGDGCLVGQVLLLAGGVAVVDVALFGDRPGRRRRAARWFRFRTVWR